MKNEFRIFEADAAPITVNNGVGARFVTENDLYAIRESRSFLDAYTPNRSNTTYYFPSQPLICIQRFPSGEYYIYLACEFQENGFDRKKSWFSITSLGQTDNDGQPLFEEWYKLGGPRARISKLTKLGVVKTSRVIVKNVKSVDSRMPDSILCNLYDNFGRELRFGEPPLVDFSHPDNSGKQSAGNTKYDIEFEVGDMIFFPKKEQMTTRVDDFEIIDGDMQLIMGCLAWTERYGYFVMPMSVFRRIPLNERFYNSDRTDYELLFEDNAFGEMMSLRMPDYKRLQLLYDSIVIVKDKLILHAKEDKLFYCYKWGRVVFV